MSDETKNITAPEAEPAQATAPEPEATGKTTAKGKTKSEAKPKAETKPKAKPAAGSTLQSVGLDACKRHGIAEVWTTADGQSFAQECDAKAHAANLTDKQILNVKAK